MAEARKPNILVIWGDDFLDHEMEVTRRLQQARAPSESDSGRLQPGA